MTRRIISILLSVLMIFSTFPVGVFAQENIELSLGTALVEGADVKVPVILNTLPDNFDKLASVYMTYSYDSDVLTYVGTEGAAIALADGQSRDGGISWFDSNSDVVADNTVLFYLLFTADEKLTTEIVIDKAELGAANRKICIPETNGIVLFEQKAEFKLSAQVAGDVALVDVYLDKLPGDIDNIAAATISYTYDKDILAYNKVMPGALTLVDGESAKDGYISWYTTTPIEEIDNTYLFTLVFDVVADTDASTVVGISNAEIASSSYAISEYVETGKVQIDIVKEVPTVDAEVIFGDATIEENKAYVPVSLNAIPNGLKDIAAFDMPFTYSEEYLTYAGVEAGTMPVSEATVSDKKVSWFSATAITDVSAPLFTLVFDIKSDVKGTAVVGATAIEIADSDRDIFADVIIKGTSFDVDTIVEIPVVLESITVDPATFEVPYGADALAAVKAAITKVTATYSDATTKEVTEYAVELNADATKAIVTYEGKTAEIALTYEPAPVVLESITVEPAEFEVPYGEDALEAVKAAITKVTATYSDATTKEVTEYAVELNADATKAIVTYEDKTAEIALTYEAAPVVPALALDSRVEGTKVYVPVSLNMIPEGLKDIASFDMPYTYSEDYLTFAGVEAGTMSVSEATVSGKKVSWYSATAITDVSAPLFTLVFDIKDNVNGTAIISATGIELGDSDRKIFTDVELGKTSIFVMGGTVVPTIVGIKTNIAEIEIPLNTTDVLAFIRSNIKVIAVYNTGYEEEITQPVDIAIDGTDIKVSFGEFNADDVAMSYIKATAKADDKVVDTEEREFEVGISMDGIPADIADIAAITVDYTYDADVEYVGTGAGIIPVDESSATDGRVSWYANGTPVTVVDNSTLFTLVFKAPCDADKEFDIVFNIEIADSNRVITANIVAEKATVKVSPVPHVWGDWATTKAPTLEEDGEETRICSNCDKKETRPVVLTEIAAEPATFEVPYGAVALEAVKEAITAVTATFSNGATLPVPADKYTVALNAEETKAIVTYADKTAEIVLTYEAAPVVLESITVEPSTFEVPYGADAKAAVEDAITEVTAIYSDGSTAIVTGYTVEITTDGAKAIVTYEDKTAEIALTYEAAPVVPALALDSRVEGTKVYVPVSLNMIPESLKNIASFDMPYTYSEDYLTFAGVEAGTMPVSEATVSGKKVSWYSATAITDVSAPLFTLVFDIKDNVNGTAIISATGIELGDSDRKISSDVELSETSIVVMGGTVVPTIVGIKTNIAEIEIPLNTTDVLAFIRSNIKVIAVYNTGYEEEITQPVDIAIDGTDIKVSFGEFKADDVAMSYTKATAKADDKVVDTEEREFEVGISMDGIPADITDIASITVDYTYDADVEYVGTVAGIIPVDESTATDGRVSWYANGTPVTVVDNSTLFTLVFKAPCDADKEFDIVFNIEIADSNRVITANIVAEKATVKVSPVPHVWSDWATTKAPTLEEDGEETRICSNCDKKETRPVVLTEIAAEPATFEVPYGADALVAVKEAITAVTATFSNGATLPVPADKYAVDLSTDGAKAIVTYADKTAEIALTYEAAPVVTLESITVEPATFEVPYGTEDVAAAVKAAITKVTATYSDGTVEDVLEYTVALTTDGTKAIVTYEDKTAEIALTYVTLDAIKLNHTTLTIPYKYHRNDPAKKMEYVKLMTKATAVLSDGRELAISKKSTDLTYTDEGNTVVVAYKGVQTTLNLTLESDPAIAEVYPDIPVINEATRDISVSIVISEIPNAVKDVEGITQIEAIDITYDFDSSKLVYKNTNGADSNLNADGSESGKADINVDVHIDIDDVTHTPKAVIELHAPCNVDGPVTISISGIMINGVDVSRYFERSSIEFELEAVECVYGEWHVPAGSSPTDYKNGKEVQICSTCGDTKERPIRVVDIATASEFVTNGITVPYAYHAGKSETQIAEYIKTLGNLAVATLTTKQSSGEAYTTNLDNDDIVVTVDRATGKATIKYLNAYNPETDTTYVDVCEIALAFAANTQNGNGSGSGSGSGSRPSIGGGFAGGSYAPNASTTMFSDVPSTHYAYEAIKDLYNRGIVSGDESGRINPDLGITREETAKVALLVNGIAVEKGLSIDFADKSKVSDWAYDYVATAIKHGILKGYDDGTVRPRDTVSREEMVAIVVRALNVQVSGNAESKYTDVESGRWSVGYIKAASDLGLITGYGDGTFKPATDIKRAEAFTIYHRVIKFKNTLIAAIN